ncbi:uncharacterized protein TRIADDRAFT_60332 [Trichoplax adhaerens]|uniref:Protein phosphatase 1 regulatory subunit 35 C-terminal domain-containing protein n=1 Tax=Trichoplax adhaerens TaxID=10228 RepID=B3S7X7_TRIAD|nr:predicted protein [Trichoplax adhaerens]EDV21092.1 predicted protein [Trichoplax adhaerens]|eukprot:XP_002116422.1 predicted protein [Trichoplax adhaerens]
MATGDYLNKRPQIRSPPAPIQQFKDVNRQDTPIRVQVTRHDNENKKHVNFANDSLKTEKNGSRIPTKIPAQRKEKSSDNGETNGNLLQHRQVLLSQPRLNSTKVIRNTLKQLENSDIPDVILTDEIKASVNSKASHALNTGRNQQRYHSLLPLEGEDSALVLKTVPATKTKYIRKSTEPITHIDDCLPNDYFSEVSPFDFQPMTNKISSAEESVTSAFEFYQEMQRWI